MASITRETNGRKRIQWIDPDNSDRRCTLRMGEVSIKVAESVKVRIEEIIAHKVTGTPHTAELAGWIRDLPDELHTKISRTGLLTPRSETAATLGQLLDRYMETINVKQSTRTRYGQTERLLLEHFGMDRSIRTIRPVDADLWRAWLVEQEYAAAKVSKEIQIARQVFKAAVRWEMIPSNPFESVKAGTQRNPDRLHYVSIEDTMKLIDEANSPDWRCIIALARFGGLRCPSEVLRLRWMDVDWERNRIRVQSPKTEHHAGKAERIIPLFPELRAVLLASFEDADVGGEYVVEGYRDAMAVNLRTQLERIIARAGLKPWPRLFNALRASRATELAHQYPAAVCTAWMGHTAAVAEAHYHMVRDTDFERAANITTQGGAKCGAPLVQNAAQSASSMKRQDTPETAQVSNTEANRRFLTDTDKNTYKYLMSATGLEPVTSAM